ncbi:hypothetical protein [Vibrio aestuarianus]|uniref:hypothetical protein n=1 Tax=Vibrio aestuarianus TaxID=28171 RepID=UPI00237CB091|nr:hypothetical protein [Vibrio aestuarianus]MDE1333317.1 hypothetical protein [Vibrio aestuarianus]
MIGMGPTGSTISGFEQFKLRFARMITTPLGSRYRHRLLGSKARNYADENAGDTMLVTLQAEVIRSVSDKNNLMKKEFEIEQCLATRTKTGVSISVKGQYKGIAVKFEVPMNV